MYQILNQANGNSEIVLYDAIYQGYTANQIIEQLKNMPAENITLRINSQGGDAFEGIALYNYLKDKNITVIIDGVCASAASIIAMAGKKIIMNEGTLLMLHNPFMYARGDAEELRDIADVLDKLTNQVANIYERRSMLNHDEIIELMNKESWLEPGEALNYGFCDEVQPSPKDTSQPESESTEPQNSAHTYEDGVKAERERLRMLDELYTPQRAGIINEAKYTSFKSANDIAIALLKNETRAPVSNMPEVNSLPVSRNDDDNIQSIADIINRKRGY